MRRFLSVKQALKATLLGLLFANCFVTYLFAAEESSKEAFCPNATYKGTLELALNDTAVPVLFEDMLFVHGGKAEKISSSNGEITLKSIILCEQNGKSIDFSVKYIGNCMLSAQEGCQITLDGRGFVKDNKLVETGNAQLRCSNNSTHQGAYTIRAAKSK